MSDLIRRSDAIKAFEDVLDCDYPFISEETPRERIEAIPTAEPKRGEWIEINKGVISIPIKWSEADKRKPIYKVKFRCSECGFQKNFIDGHTAQYNFCPNCGARMKGAGDETE